MFNYKRLLLSVVCSLAATAVIAVAAPRAYAGPPDIKAMPGEIILRALPGMSDTEISALAAKAGCVVLKPVAYCPGFYVLQLKSYADSHNNQRATVDQAAVVSDDVQSAIATLKSAMTGVAADPNFVVYLNDPKPQTPKVPLNGSGTRAKGRATAGPGTATFTPSDPLYPQQYGLTMIRMPEAWAVQAATRTVVVGLADTGIDIGHPDFNTPDGSSSRIIGGQNFFPDGPNNSVVSADYQDPAGHGTHTAGTVAATINNNPPLGVASVAGYNGGGVDVKIRVARVFGAGGSASLDTIAAGEGYLVDNNVDVMSLSLGSYGLSTIEQTVIARAISSGVIVVAAAGNDNFDNSVIPNYPSDFPDVIKVTSVGKNRSKASYSNYGGPVTVAAPGGDQIVSGDQGIISTWPRNVPHEPGSTQPIGYEALQGTSMACPHVAGVCALLIAAGAPHNAVSIKAALTSTAFPLTDDTADHKYYGSGLVDAYSALLPFINPPFSIGFPNPNIDLGTIYTGQNLNFTLNVLGVLNKPAPGGASLEIQTATYPSTTIRTFLSDTTGGFTVPSLQAGQVKATSFNVAVPDTTSPPLSLPAGRYKAVVKLADQELAVRFFEVASQTQPLGRALFSFPFQARLINAQAPEQAVFGPSAVFSLARYNPLRLPSDLDYALFQSGSNGRRDAAASFSSVAPDGSPLSFDSSNPTVSVAPVGIGYWLNLDSAVTLNTVGTPVTNPVSVRLFASGGGWNMLGAPYVNATSWATATVTAGGSTMGVGEAIQKGIIAPALIGYSNGDYVYNIYPDGLLEPFKGYWVRVFQDCTLTVAPTGTLASRSRSVLPKVNGWRARLMASVAGDRDGQNYFGQVQGASNGSDTLDIPKPPSGAGHAYLRFTTPTGPGRSVANAFDLRALDGTAEQEWTAAVSTDRTNADVTLTWDGLGSVPNRGSLSLVDSATGQSIDMRHRSSYTFRSGEAGSTRQVTIKFKPVASAGPLSITGVTVVGGSRSAAAAGLAVRFNTSRDADVTGVVKTVTGQTIGVLTGTTRSAGTNGVTMRWDGRSRSGSPVPAGPYIVEITARATDGQSATYRQPFMNNQ